MPVQVFNSMLGQTITSIQGGRVGDDGMLFVAEGKEFSFTHYQDCCEHVIIEDIAGDLEDLIGSPLLQAEEVSDQEEPGFANGEEPDISYTWTFYKFATIKGSVVIRWLGTSNGYYGESVDYEERDIAPKKQD